jgi:hypothetical protein
MPGELRHVLDDRLFPSGADSVTVDAWRDFAGFALHRVEVSPAFGDEVFFKGAGWRAVALLAAVYEGLAGYSVNGPSLLGPIVPLTTLRGMLDASGSGGLLCDFQPLARVLDNEINELKFCLVMDCGDCGGIDWLDSLWWLQTVVWRFSKCVPEEKRTLLRDGPQGITRSPYKPSETFLGRFRDGPLMGTVYRDQGPPAGGCSVETILDRLGIGGQDREMCVRYAGGASCGQVGKDIGLPTGTVKEHLAKLRRKHVELASFLKRKTAGRKARK